MKTFREQLDFLRDNKCSVCDIIIANACDAIFDFDYSETEFEVLCQIAQRAYLKSEDVHADDIAMAINIWFTSGRTIGGLVDLSTWDLIEAAINGWGFEYNEAPWCKDSQSPLDCENCEMIGCPYNPKYNM